MCFLMGAAAGGMLPVAYALLAEIMPTKHRGWCLVLVGGIGAVGGYLASADCRLCFSRFSVGGSCGFSICRLVSF